MDQPGRPPSGARPPTGPTIKGAFRSAGGYGGERIPSARQRSLSRGPGESPRVEGRSLSRGRGESPRVEGGPLEASPRGNLEANRGGYPGRPSSGPSSRPSSARPSSRPSSRGPDGQPRAERNFVEENRFPKPRSRPSSASSVRSKCSDGGHIDIAKDGNKVPKYLAKVKKAVAAEKEYIAEISGANRKDDGVPPGHRLLPDEERLEILEGLKSLAKELEQKYQKLPLSIETDGQKRREAQILKEIKDNEKAISLFSRPKVAVEL
eukprot:gnl/MRDRNA2_/MRDRNA2_115383_c0_seq1.p1 gnl/MRDRNA2_/MRDRNA2_115383_c0~~gnl/MRDRNA2_/MRDRNA2_115383_c0_seq1.p1  ORF type:complete len:265 (+),score=61.92 gnl/MRDRNA2_/MRDRNA2_115383_c0_seq1:97-891(+)